MNRRGFLKFLGAALIVPFLPKCKSPAPKPTMGVDVGFGPVQTAFSWYHKDTLHKWAGMYETPIPKYQYFIPDDIPQWGEQELMDFLIVGDIKYPVIIDPFCTEPHLARMPGIDELMRPWLITDAATT